VTTSLLTGLRLVLLDVFDAERSPLVMAEHGATFLGSAIPFFQAYLTAQRKHGPERLFPRLRSCIGGGAPNSAELHREVQAVLGGRGVCSSWGLTEFPIATAPSLDDTDEQLSTTEGRPSPGVDIRIIASDGSECARRAGGCVSRDRSSCPCANPRLMQDAFDDHGYLAGRPRHGAAVRPRQDHGATQIRRDPQRREHLGHRGRGRAARSSQSG
jgi:acyl-CoA synthetase (AMP-forming)/AMP-acid ligase II